MGDFNFRRVSALISFLWLLLGKIGISFVETEGSSRKIEMKFENVWKFATTLQSLVTRKSRAFSNVVRVFMFVIQQISLRSAPWRCRPAIIEPAKKKPDLVSLRLYS